MVRTKSYTEESDMKDFPLAWHMGFDDALGYLAPNPPKNMTGEQRQAYMDGHADAMGRNAEVVA